MYIYLCTIVNLYCNNTMSRTSSYIIPVSISNDEYLIIHGYTGAFDVVDKSLKDLLLRNSEVTEKDIKDKSIYDRLKKRGYITDKTLDEEREYVNRIADLLFKETKYYPNQYFLVVTYNCNFDCPYCYEKTLFDRNKKDFIRVITKEQVDIFYKRIQELDNDSISSKYITLFGGEPLMKENGDIVKYIIEEGKKRGFSFAATTNGYDLDVFHDFMGKELIEHLQITIDGTRETHDKRRVHILYNKSFDKIVQNIKKVLDKGVFVNVRVNVDGENYKELPIINKVFNDYGFFLYDNFSAYSSFISGENNFIPENATIDRNSITQRDFLEMFQFHDLDIIHDVKIYKNIKGVFVKNKRVNFYPYYCNSQTNMYIFDLFGHIYSCLEILGDKENIIGIYDKDKINWLEKKDLWKKRNISKIHKCSKCKYALFCGGGCLTKTFTDDRKAESYCDSFPTIFRYTVREIYNKYCVR